MRDYQHPFFRPLWRRIAIVLVCVVWAVLEYVSNSQTWAMIAAGMAAYAAWQYLYLYQAPPPAEPAKPDDKE